MAHVWRRYDFKSLIYVLWSIGCADVWAACVLINLSCHYAVIYKVKGRAFR